MCLGCSLPSVGTSTGKIGIVGAIFFVYAYTHVVGAIHELPLRSAIMLKLTMKKKSLIETNPYLKDPELRAALIERSVATFTAIEGVRIKIPKLSKKLIKKMRDIAAAQKTQNKSQ